MSMQMSRRALFDGHGGCHCSNPSSCRCIDHAEICDSPQACTTCWKARRFRNFGRRLVRSSLHGALAVAIAIYGHSWMQFRVLWRLGAIPVSASVGGSSGYLAVPGGSGDSEVVRR